MFNPTTILAAVLAFVLSVGGAYVWGRHDGNKIQEAEQARVDRMATEAFNAAQKATASEIAKIKIVNSTVVQKLEREIYEKPVYRECVNTPDGMLAINAALAGTSIGAGNRKLPRIDTAGK